jgi:hypothetical protein
MPVIRRGNGNRIQIFILECFANIGYTLTCEPAFDLSFKILHLLRQHSLIGIDKVGDFHIVLVQPALHVTAASAVYACYGNTQTVIGAYSSTMGFGAEHGKCSSGD